MAFQTTTRDVIDSVGLGVWIATLLAGLIVGTVHLFGLIESLRLTLTHPYSLSYTGGYLAYYIDHPLQLYQPPDPIPHPTIYPPLVPLLVPTLPNVPTVIVGRAVNWLAIAASSTMLAWHAHRRSGSYAAAGVAGGLFLLSPAVTSPTVLLRVDHIALALALAAITAYTRRIHLVTVGALCIAAGFAKQPYAIIAIAPIALAEAARGGRRDAKLFASATAVVGLLLFWHLDWGAGGQAFVHLVHYNLAIPWHFEGFLTQVYTFLFTHGIAIGAGIGLVAASWRPEVKDPIAWLFVVGLVLALAMVGKEGSWIGYFYPAIAGGAVLLGSAVIEYGTSETMPTHRQVAALVVVIAVVAQFGLYTMWDPQPERSLQGQEDAAAVLASADAPVLSEDPSIAPSGGPPVDVLMLKGLIVSGAVEGDPLAEAMRCGEYRMVATFLGRDSSNAADFRFTQAQLEALETHFEPAQPVRGHYLYRYVGSGSEECEPSAAVAA